MNQSTQNTNPNAHANGEKDYVYNEITVYKTNKNLLAFSDRMNPATLMNR